MRRRKYIRGNFDRKDIHRPILTETVPFEVPIVFSNDGFYLNLSLHEKAGEGLKEIIRKIVSENPRNYTIPYRYKIAKNSTVARQLSLLHPMAQLSVCHFYKQYENLICYYCTQSAFSIRYPAKIGSSYFFKGTLSERNMYKRDSIDTVTLDQVVRNPASYFAYRQYDRLYKFFRSTDFVRLEKKFSIMTFLDISNCFGSIYTHAIAWAVKDIHHAKENTKASSFGNNFDKLMQRMNFNETNGICIGPEVSRIFAEIILQRIDENVMASASKLNLQNKVHYECRRYVDDYLVFAQNPEIAQSIQNIIADQLAGYHLHLNEQKREIYERPFQTKKSQIIDDIDRRLAEFNKSCFDRYPNKFRSVVPRRLYRPDAVVRTFISSMRACCFELGAGYEMIANYVISSFCATIEDLIESYSELATERAAKAKETKAAKDGENTEDKEDDDNADDEMFVAAFLVLLELIYFLYTVQPTVGASFKVAKATILSCRFFRNALPDRQALLSERLSSWMMVIARGSPSDLLTRSKGAVPIEVINIVLALSELDDDYLLNEEFLQRRLFEIDNAEYFTLISCLFYIKNKEKYPNLKKAIQKRIVDLLNGSDVLRKAEDAHLFLDLLSCPFLTVDFRRKILKEIRSRCELEPATNASLLETVGEMELKPWFVRWEAVDLLNMIRKKELSAVY